MSLAVGVDVGGTKIVGGVVDDDGRVLERTRRPSPNHDATELREAVVAVVRELSSGHPVTQVGVGAAGPVRADRRGIYFAPHLVWGTEPVADLLADELGLPVVLENDGNAAAWAESRFGAGRGLLDQLLVTVGTGVGGGLILNGELVRGGHGMAGEIGHIGLVRGGRPCECGRLGCLEEYASGSSLTHNAREAAAAGTAPALLAAADGDATAVTGAMVTELALAGDTDALRLFDEVGDALGTGIASLVAVLDPTVVLIGGGVSQAGDALMDPTRRALTREITGQDRRPHPELRLAALGDDAGLIGAADLARHAPR